MEALVGGLIGVVIVQFSFLWFRLGKVEQKLRDINGNLSQGAIGKGGDKNA